MQRAAGSLGSKHLWVAFALSCLFSLWCFSSTAGAAGCPNEQFRTGPSAALPDCRAYELVTPPDTNGRLLETIGTYTFGQPYDLFATELASPSRDSFVYMTYDGPLRSPEGGNGVFDVYQAERLSEGWQTTQHLSRPAESLAWALPGGVASDHAYSFTNEGGTDYLGDTGGPFELTGSGSLGSEPYAQGRYISEGGEHVVFTTGDSSAQSAWCSGCQVLKLELNAPPTGTGAVYDRSADGPTHVVSLLPGDVTPAAGEEAFYKGASKGGTSIAFTIEGTLYVRVDNAETLEAAAGEPTYAGLSADGRYLFYVAGGNIHRFDTTTEEDNQVNSTGDAQVSNVSADGSHVYFISKSQIGAAGTAGQPNMYVWSGGAAEYVATVAPSDLERTSGTVNGVPALGNWTDWVTNPPPGAEQGPGAEASRATSDGTVLVFESRAQLTPYDNDDHTAIYRYDDADKSLLCVSCNPLAEPATADARLQELALVGTPIVIHNLSADGSRVFFEAKEALVARDINGVNDVYQWHQEEGGVISRDLISSGQAPEYPIPVGWESPFVPRPNLLFGATPDGEDVFFLAQEALAPGAPEGGTAAVYDARVNGGFPARPTPVVCIEEGCRPAPQPIPSFLIPASETTVGAGNVKPRKHRRCQRKNKQGRKHRRCTKQKPKQRQARFSVAASGEEAAVEEVEQPAIEQLALAQLVDGASSASAPSHTSAAGPIAAAEPVDFGIESVSAIASPPAAGMHPDFTTYFALDHVIDGGLPKTDATAEEISISLPPGLLGNPNAIPRCKTGEFVAFANCPTDSQVGIATVTVGNPLFGTFVEPVYNLEPPHPKDEVARFGFIGGLYPVFIDIKVRTASDYGVTATVHSSPGQGALIEAETTLWGNPADPSHDEQRLTSHEATKCPGTACEAPGGKRPSTIPPAERRPFMTNPSACQPMAVGFAVKSYQLPGQVFSATAPMAPIDDCIGLPFDPSFVAEPTNPVAGAPTGLKTTLTLPQAQDPDLKGTSTMRSARVTLPEGMTIAAGAADGLAACSDAQVGYKQEVDAACPDASKLGTATITSPSLPEPLRGALYQRTPEPGRLFGLWLVTDELGLHVKLPGEIKPDPSTGQLTATFTDLPQVPVSEIELNVWGGPRAPLKNPESCGTYPTTYTFTPHSQDPPVSGASATTIDRGCATGSFSPQLHAGVTHPLAGAHSPLIVDVTRQDGEQNLGNLEIKLPKGELAKLKGVPLCSESLASSGNCPQASRIGHLTAAVGPGPQPLWLPQPGKAATAVYLGGPYKGAPFSVVTVVPAQAGPFDLGLVTVRSALDVDPVTAQAIVRTDPLPQFIEGVAAIYRRVHVVVDRPGFSLNPTNCSELQTTSTITSVKGAVAHPASRFQVDGCKALGFKPKLSLALKGGTKRGDYPALTAVLKARKGDADVGRVSVALPHSAFLAQEHIVTICTRKRFAKDDCPKGSVYGKAKAFTPLLDKPLEGPVYLRSSDNPLPDLVVALKGQIEVELAGRIDSKDEGLRTTFDSVPDAPITRFVLRMKGGKKGLLVNSESLCVKKNRATVRVRGQNGRKVGLRPVVGVKGCGGKGK